MGAQSRLVTSLATGSNATRAAGIAALCAVMLLAGCGGSGGSASDASTPVIRGDVAGDGGSTVTAPGYPPAPTIVAGANKITVTVAPGTSGGTPTSYEVYALRYDPSTKSYSTPRYCTVSGASGSCEVTGLTPGKMKASASATNTAGTSGYGSWSAWAWVETAPGTPPAPTVVAGTAKVTATVAAGTSGGAPASYTVTAYDTVSGTAAGACTVTGASGFCEVTPLTGGNTYTVKATAKNTGGDSGESVASSPVTVVAPSSTVTFDANGGTETMENQTANMSTPLNENVFKRSGYVFDGWATTSTGDKAYGNGDDYKFGENVTLYARWVAAPSPVTTQAATVPGAPALTALSRRSKTEVWVTFSAPSSDGGKLITGYTVTATRNGVDVTQSFPAEAGRVSVGPLTRYAVYTFTVRAVNSVGTSEPSKASRFTVG